MVAHLLVLNDDDRDDDCVDDRVDDRVIVVQYSLEKIADNKKSAPKKKWRRKCF